MSRSSEAIGAVLTKFGERYSAKDVDGVLELFDGEDSVVVGTGADEVRFGLAAIRSQVERDISQADSIAMTFGDLRISEAGDAAFVYASMAFEGVVHGEAFKLPARLTVGLVRSGGEWRARQFHTSVAFGDQVEGESFPG